MTRLLDFVETGLGVLAALLVAAILGCVCYQVVARYGFNAASTWSDTVASSALAWLTFLSTSLAVRSDDNLSVRFLWNGLHPTGRRVARTVCDLLILLFSLILAFSGSQLIEATRGTTVEGIPFHVSWAQMYSITLISAVLMTVFSVESILRTWKAPR